MRESLRSRTVFTCGLLVGVFLCGTVWLVFGSKERGERSQQKRSLPETPELRSASSATVTKKPRAPMPTYVRPALAQFNAMVAEIQTRIDDLRERGTTARADEMAKSLERFTQLPTVKYSDVKTSDPEVHAIGLYEPDEKRNRTDAPPKAQVKVTYTGGPIVLVLTSNEPVTWDIDLADGVQLQTAIISGYYHSQVCGLPESVPVLNNWIAGEGDSKQPRFYAYSKNSDQYTTLLNGVREVSGLEVITFQGAYRYPGTPFVIGPENHEWRYQHIIAQMRDLHAEAALQPQK